MSDGKWSGGAANRTWARPGSRYQDDGMTGEQRGALYESVADEPFFDETCGAVHPLREHRDCRNGAALREVAGTDPATPCIWCGKPLNQEDRRLTLTIHPKCADERAAAYVTRIPDASRQEAEKGTP